MVRLVTEQVIEYNEGLYLAPWVYMSHPSSGVGEKVYAVIINDV